MNDRNHIHDLGSSTKCACGYELKVPRFGFTLEVFDNNLPSNSRHLDFGEEFMTNDAHDIAEFLREAANKLESL